MEMLRDVDIDPSPLAGRRVAILGYGNQGRAQALNLKDSGIDVVVGLRGGSGSNREAELAGLETALIETAVGSADVVMMLAPDEIHAALYREIEPHLRKGAALGFSHGLSVRFGFFREAGGDQPGAPTTDSLAVGEGDAARVAACVLFDRP
jgi:ketol-acid reductoisomerase